ncbi:hypothetical protein [Methylobacterium sp. J-070]|uniref:hypothetical protein n=1 Tax=Methylobacterium sp. J-070 TaxID=2836650 RepID=UPI001FB9F197|nr:hypothetical protein [Methylobacterium sp. J-070]MCJ2052685.1 hypothetical protein [Methylobacterium sp. J-070]
MADPICHARRPGDDPKSYPSPPATMQVPLSIPGGRLHRPAGVDPGARPRERCGVPSRPPRPHGSAFVAEEPGLLGCPEADAFLGGAGEHLVRRWGLPVPDWVRAESRYLATTLFVPDDRALRGYLLCVSPVAFRTRLIFTGPDPLQRARFPYRHGVITMPAEHPRGALPRRLAGT